MYYFGIILLLISRTDCIVVWTYNPNQYLCYAMLCICLLSISLSVYHYHGYIYTSIHLILSWNSLYIEMFRLKSLFQYPAITVLMTLTEAAKTAMVVLMTPSNNWNRYFRGVWLHEFWRTSRQADTTCTQESKWLMTWNIIYYEKQYVSVFVSLLL